MLCEQSSIIFFLHKDGILLYANCAKYVNSALSTIVCALWRYYWCYLHIMWAMLILHYLNTSACILNFCEYICFSSFGTCTPFYIFSTLLFHALGVDRCFQACSYKYRYINKAFHDCKAGQQCPMEKMETVEVETCKVPHNEECVPVGNLLRCPLKRPAMMRMRLLNS